MLNDMGTQLASLHDARTAAAAAKSARLAVSEAAHTESITRACHAELSADYTELLRRNFNADGNGGRDPLLPGDAAKRTESLVQAGHMLQQATAAHSAAVYDLHTLERKAQ